MLAAGFLANLRIQIDDTQLVPAWVALALVALALWVVFHRTTARWGWSLCPLWWSGYAIYDLGLRLAEQRSATGWGFVIGTGLILLTLNSASNHTTRKRRARVSARRGPGRSH